MGCECIGATVKLFQRGHRCPAAPKPARSERRDAHARRFAPRHPQYVFNFSNDFQSEQVIDRLHRLQPLPSSERRISCDAIVTNTMRRAEKRRLLKNRR